jgi:hypothetical protein
MRQSPNPAGQNVPTAAPAIGRTSACAGRPRLRSLSRASKWGRRLTLATVWPPTPSRHERRLDPEITERYGPDHTRAAVSEAWHPCHTGALVHPSASERNASGEIGGRSSSGRLTKPVIHPGKGSGERGRPFVEPCAPVEMTGHGDSPADTSDGGCGQSCQAGRHGCSTSRRVAAGSSPASAGSPPTSVRLWVRSSRPPPSRWRTAELPDRWTAGARAPPLRRLPDRRWVRDGAPCSLTSPPPRSCCSR